MLRIGLEDLLVALEAGREHTSLFEAVELYPDGISGFAELRLETPQIRGSAAVEEELQQEFYPRFR
jgi:hypothetical protein